MDSTFDNTDIASPDGGRKRKADEKDLGDLKKSKNAVPPPPTDLPPANSEEVVPKYIEGSSHIQSKKTTAQPSWVWKFMHHFERPQNVNGKMQTHICILCLQERGPKHWQGCSLGTDKKKMTASQAQSHLEKVHRDNPIVQRHLKARMTTYPSFAHQISVPSIARSEGGEEQRTEVDSMGLVNVPGNSYYGAQTGRSLKNFNIGTDVMPRAVIRSLGVIKQAAARANVQLGVLDVDLGGFIVTASEEVIAGKLDDNFPLKIWQTGSGTQTNMNCNEVIANRAIELSGGVRGSKDPIHPNDHVNRGQSSNDTFPSAMHIATAEELSHFLIPSIDKLIESFTEKAAEFKDIVKVARTHMMDATPITLEQEFSGFVAQLKFCRARLKDCLAPLYELALGGTAVGTGVNTVVGFDVKVAKFIAKRTGLPFVTGANKFALLGGCEALVNCSSALKGLAIALMKVANDIRLLGSGPRCGLNDIALPANEPGSSIMPGKVNPTQCEAMTMICCQVIGNDAAISTGALQGQLQLNVYRPMIIHNLLHSIRLLTDGSRCFRENCIAGIKPNREVLEDHLQKNLMLVTALNPHIGYDKASDVAKKAYKDGISLRDAIQELQYMSGEEFDKLVDPLSLTRPTPRDDTSNGSA